MQALHWGAGERCGLLHPPARSLATPRTRAASVKTLSTSVSTIPATINASQGRSSSNRSVVMPASAASAASTQAAGKKAVVVGAGPTGAVTAMFLAKQGWKVDVFEKLAPMVDAEGKVQASIGPRSYNILLTERAIEAVEAAGADLSGFDIPDLQCSMRHKLKGGAASGTMTRLPGRFKLANRGTLAGALVQQCLAQHADSVQFHFEQELHMIDTVSGAAYFRPVESAAQLAAVTSSTGCGGAGSSAEGTAEGGSFAARSSSGATPAVLDPPQVLSQQRAPVSPDSLVSCTCDLLVGADGTNSLVRRVLERHDKELQVSVTRDVMEFRTCVLGMASEFLPDGAPGEGTFQTWTNPKLQATLIGSSTGDGVLRCVFILPEGVHASLKTAADYEAYLAKAIPSLPEAAIKRAAPQLVEAPISNGGVIVRCSKLNSRGVVLVGDAGHSVYPSLGQGANSALEGAATLATVLQEMGTQDVEAAAAEYSRRWLPNALAVADLTEEGFGKNARAFAPNLKMAQLICQMFLHKVLPFLVPKPAFFQLNSTSMPYSVILKRTKQEMLVFKASLAAAAAAVLAVLVRNFARPALTALGLA